MKFVGLSKCLFDNVEFLLGFYLHMYILQYFFFVCLDTAADPTGPSWLDKIQQTVQNILEAVNLLKTPIDKSGKTLEELPFVYTR